MEAECDEVTKASDTRSQAVAHVVKEWEEVFYYAVDWEAETERRVRRRGG